MKRICSLFVFFSFFCSPIIFAIQFITKFEKKIIKLSHNKVIVEIADTNEKAEQGLMYRKTLGKNEGMLFIFPNEEKRNFWMKNTFIDLSIAFFDSSKILTETCDMKASSSELIVKPESCETVRPAKFALEMSRGWFRKHNIKVGEKFQFTTNK
jgi:hypothetical protein